MSEHDQRVRHWAERLWQEAGRPQSGSEAYIDRARELVAIEENEGATLRPLGPGENVGAAGEPHLPDGQAGPTGEPAEPTLAVENAGEFPTLTDEGEQQPAPRWPQQKNR